MSRLAIVLLTYTDDTHGPRAEYAHRTLRSALDNVVTSCDISVHIADDGSPEEHRQALIHLAGGYAHVRGISVTNAQRGGYGRSYNLATQTVHRHVDYVLPLEDDWVLEAPLNIDPYLAAMSAPNGPGCIRLGYIGMTQELRGLLVPFAGNMYLMFDPDSPEPHVFAGHPRLETVAWERRVGPWPEGVSAGTTEFLVAHKREARERVAWPMNRGPFAHVGTVQARTDQQ